MKAYQSPLHLIPEEALSSLSEDRLRRIRKEVMLQFELSDATTIQLNGRTYDRTAVLQAFEQLEKNFSYHLLLFQDKALLRFIEGEDISLFYEDRTWEELGDASFLSWLTPFFQARLGKTINQCIQKPGFFSIKKLRAFNESSLQVPYSISFQAYAKPYEELDYMVKEAEKAFSQPFSSAKGLRLKKGLESHLSAHLFNVFRWLPSEFYGLRERYTIAAHNMLADIFKRNRYFKNFRVEELKLMKMAAQFSSTFRPDLKATRVFHQLSRAIESRNDYNTPAVLIGIIIFVVIIAIYSVYNTNRPRKIVSVTSLSSPEVIFNTPSAIKSSLAGKTWKGIAQKKYKGSRRPLHFFTFFNDNEGEHAILLPLERDQKYASVSMPFKWGVSQLRAETSDLTLAYTSAPEMHGVDPDKLTKVQQKLLEYIETFTAVPSIQYPVRFDFPSRITFMGFMPDTLRHTNIFTPLRAGEAWEATYGINQGEHPFVDRLLAASAATDYLLQHASIQNKDRGFKLYVHPNDLSVHLQRGFNPVAIGQLVQTNDGLTISPYKWVEDTTNLPSYFIWLNDIPYFDENEDLKTGTLMIYYLSFSADTAQVIVR